MRALAARVFVARRPLRDRVVTAGRVVDAGGATIDEGLAIFFRAPRSYTGEDVLELHVHGSPAVASEVLAALLAAGAALAGPGEFTRRAYLARKIDLSAAEAVADLIAAEHRSAARAAAARLSGGLGTEVERVRTTLERTLQELAAAIDFPDDVADPDRALVSERLEDARAALAALAHDLGTRPARARGRDRRDRRRAERRQVVAVQRVARRGPRARFAARRHHARHD